jgi:hypothetical protein
MCVRNKSLVGRIFIFSFLCIPLLFISCYKLDSGQYNYTPTFSLPVGSISTTFADVVSTLQLYPAPSDSTRIDSIPVLMYDDNLFYTPFTFDTIYTEYFNFQDMRNTLENATEIVFRINYLNYFPTAVAGQVYFLNDIHTVVDSLLPDGFYEVAAGSVNNNGEVTAPAIDRIEIPLSREKIENLFDVQFFATHTHMHLVPANNEVYRFYSDQYFEMQIALRISIEREFNR